MSSISKVKSNSKKYSKYSERTGERTARRVAQSNGFSKFIGTLLKAFILAFFGFLVLFPFYYMISMALMSYDEIQGVSPLFPSDLMFSNFIDAINNGFIPALIVSTLVLLLNIILKVTVCMLLGYAFANYEFKCKNLLWWLMMITLTIPEVALISGQYNVTVNMGFSDGPLIILGLSVPFIASIFTGLMFRTAFEAIPNSVKEAAIIDGITGPAYFFKVAMPMVSSTTWTVVILTTFASWNSYMWPALLLIGTESYYHTIPIWLFDVARPVDEGSHNLPQIQMAGSVLATLPTIVIYFLFKNKINAVVAGGGNKG